MNCPKCTSSLHTTGISGSGTIYKCSQCKRKWIIKEVTNED
jgi:transposase-like protein